MFAKNLAKLRKTKKLTQYELAEELGFSRGQISNYEQGQREPDYEILLKIADYFQVSVDFLLGHEVKGENKNYFDEAEAIMFRDIEGFNNLPEDKKDEIKKLINDQIEYLIYKEKRDSEK